jgi:cytochrome P450
MRAKLEDGVKGGPDEEKGVRHDIFHYLFRAKDPETGVLYSWADLSAEANLLVVAGSDTSSVVLSGFFFYMTRYPRVYAKLVSEIRQTFDTVEEIKGGPKLSACQYLRACIDETLRMCPATPGELPRVVQKPGLEVDGSFVPEGVQVGVPLWPLQHKQEYFGDPFFFRPERWIVDEAAGVTPDDVALAQSAFFPFSSGSYNCVGQRLAIIELLIIMARMLYLMDFRLQPGDRLGEGSPELGWGRRDKRIFQFQDFYVGQRKGPMVQFRKRDF